MWVNFKCIMPNDKAKFKVYNLYNSTCMTSGKRKIEGQKMNHWLSGDGCDGTELTTKALENLWRDGNILYLDWNGVYTTA